VQVRTADERGITLQTLIVTAVLVLMAVAAGVVIVAITNSASDDLEDQTTSIEARCNGVEVFDSIVASSNIPGRNGPSGTIANVPEAKSATIGCVPVCVWTAAADDDTTIHAGELSFARSKSTLEDGTTDGFAAAIADLEGDEEHFFKTPTELFRFDGDTLTDTTNMQFASGIAEVKVSPNQRTCLAYSSTGDVVT